VAVWRRGACAFLLALSSACGGDDGPASGQPVDMVEVASLPKGAIDQSTAASGLQALSGPARCDVSVRALDYRTSGPRGEDVILVSAALLVPGGDDCRGPFPLVAYSKGTDIIRARTLADPADPETATLVGMFAARGYAVVAADYIGFARSDYPYHPYVEADSEAATNLDAVRAARAALLEDGVILEAGVYLAGYSQGGHASMASQRAAERDRSHDIEVAAAGHSSGPYDLGGSFLTGISLLPAGSGGSIVFVPYAVTGYQKTYGNLYAAPSDFFKPPYDSWIEELLPGTLSTGQLVATGRLPTLLGDLITPRLVTDLQTPGSGLRQALERNTLLNWTPLAPTLLCGGARDPVVDFRNTLQAQATFQARGAGSVTVVDVEQVPAFAPQFPATLSPAQLSAYHGATVAPLCLKIVRDQLFEPARAARAEDAPLKLALPAAQAAARFESVRVAR
jgi:pimeloyl-ACP methyl ester carboxylesterase